MKTNKLKLLMVSLFLSNVKSVMIRHTNGQPYRYIETKNSLQTITQNETIIEHIINEQIQEKMREILEGLISEIIKLESTVPGSNYIFEIENNSGIFAYQVTKTNGFTIELVKNTINPFTSNQQGSQATHIIQYDNINNTVLALSYINSFNMGLFLKENAAKKKDVPNSNVYIYGRNWLICDTNNHSFHIFEENNIEAKDNLRFLLQTQKEKEEIITLFDKRNFTFQNMMMVLTLCSTIIVPLVIAQMTKK